MRTGEIATIRRLATAVLATGVLGVAGLGVAIVTLQSQPRTILTSRRDSRLDTCHLLRNLALRTATPAHRPIVRKFLRHSELRDCVTYSELGK
jgi:hypothetical protein